MPTSMPTWREVGSWSVALEATLLEDVEYAETPKTEAPPEDHAQLLSLATPPPPTPPDEDEPAAARKKQVALA